MITLCDQLSNPIQLDKPAKRIVSLVPSITELLAYYGLNDETVGITRFCVRPGEWFRSKQRIGGTKNVHIATVKALSPDLIIANKEENVVEQVNELAGSFPVYVSDVNDLQSAITMMLDIGIMTGKSATAQTLVKTIKEGFTSISKPAKFLKVCYLIWQQPFMTVGGDTFISKMLSAAGFSNCFVHLSRYPEVSINDIIAANCDYIFLSSEPFPFKQKHVAALQMLLIQHENSTNTSQIPSIHLVDGEMFSWYGSRLLEAPGYFEKFQNDL